MTVTTATSTVDSSVGFVTATEERMYPGKRVCMFAQGLPGGGAERVLINLMVDFIRRGMLVDLVLTNRTGDYLELVPNDVSIIDLGTRLPRASIGALVRYLRSVRPDALLSIMDNTNMIAVIARAIAGVPTKIGIGVHNTLSAEIRGEPGLRLKVLSRAMRWLYPRADLIACVSAGVADDLSAVTGIRRNKLDVIYNPVVTNKLLQQALEPLDHPWFAPGEPPVVLSVGRLSPQKDQTVLIEAFAKLRRSRPCRLLILGQGPEREKLEAKVFELGVQADVSLPGFVQNPFPYLAHAAVFALSSRWEGLPMSIIEALACGTQVVSTECPSGPNEILAGGKYGWLVPTRDPDALATALSEAIDKRTPPTEEAWRPYVDSVSAGQYCKKLFGD